MTLRAEMHEEAPAPAGGRVWNPFTATLAPPVTVQLRRPNGPCWEAVYSTPATQDVRSFKAKSD